MNEMDEYISSLKRKHTQEYYKLALDKYFKAINKKPQDYFKNKKTKNNHYEKDIETFVSSINKLAPVTQKNYISVIKNFFYFNDVELKQRFWKLHVRNKIEDGGALTLDRAPRPDELKKILQYGDLKARALFCMLCSTGMRIGEALQIQVSDIELDHDPPMITIRSTYVKGKRRPRWVFMSNEARDLLKLWLEPSITNDQGIKESERDRYLRFSAKKLKGVRTKSLDDTRVFPICDSMARQMWHKLIHKAQLDKKSSETNRYELHVHSLRKFFMSQMKLGIPEVVVEALSGHSKYLDEAYRRYSVDQLAGFYKTGMQMVSIFEVQPDLSGINQELKAKDEKIKDMERRLNDLEILKELYAQKLDIEKLKNGSKEKKKE